MNTSESTLNDPRLEELRALRAPSFIPYLLPLLLMASFGFLIWSDGRDYASVFFGALTITFTLHSIAERRSRKEIDLVLAMLDDVRKAK